MAYQSASYQPRDPAESPGEPQYVLALDEEGRKHYFREDSQGVDWLAYKEAGGIIEEAPPYVPPEPPDWDAIDADNLDRLLVQDGSPLRAVAQAQFTILNDVRELQGKPPLTAAQYKSHLKGLMRD